MTNPSQQSERKQQLLNRIDRLLSEYEEKYDLSEVYDGHADTSSAADMHTDTYTFRLKNINEDIKEITTGDILDFIIDEAIRYGATNHTCINTFSLFIANNAYKYSSYITNNNYLLLENCIFIDITYYLNTHYTHSCRLCHHH
jgi:hypothetical protein